MFAFHTSTVYYILYYVSATVQKKVIPILREKIVIAFLTVT